jgi:hypothetical protein
MSKSTLITDNEKAVEMLGNNIDQVEGYRGKFHGKVNELMAMCQCCVKELFTISREVAMSLVTFETHVTLEIKVCIMYEIATI